MVNRAGLGFVTISNSNKLAKSMLDDLAKKIERNYQVEIIEKNIERLY